MMAIPERTKQSLNGLCEMVDYLDSKYPIKDMTILEIGSWTGLSALTFAPRFKHVYCVDPWDATEGINTQYNMAEVEKLFDKRIEPFKNITKLKCKSEECNFLWMVDIIYIDGCHTYDSVKQDIKIWLPKVKAVIAGHDYWPKKFDGVIKAVNEMLGKPDKVFPDTSWIKEI